jgi:hypothetical protein
VDGDDRGARTPERQRVLEVGERRLELAEEPRHAPRHPQLLDARRQLDAVDAGRDEVRPARDRGEPEVGRRGGQAPEQVLDVRLVAGALAPEDVGVDRD